MSRSIPMLSVLLLGATLSLPAHADPISWTNLDFRASGDSHLGRSSTVPGPFIGTDIRRTLSSSTQLTPVPGPTDSDDFSTDVSLPLAGSENARSAATTGRIIGDPAGTLSMAGHAGAAATNNNLADVSIKAEAVGGTRFTGQFVSAGGPLDLAFDGGYDLFTFVQNEAAISPQRAEAVFSLNLIVEDLTDGTVLFSGSLFSDSLVRTLAGVSHKDGVPFSGQQSTDLDGTAGNRIQVTLEAVLMGTAYAARVAGEEQSATGTEGVATLDLLDFSFSGIPVPEPSALALLLVAGILGTLRRFPAR